MTTTTFDEILKENLPPSTQKRTKGPILKKGDIFNLPVGVGDENLLICFWRTIHPTRYKEYFEEAEEGILRSNTKEVFESAEHAVEYYQLKILKTQEPAVRAISAYPEHFKK